MQYEIVPSTRKEHIDLKSLEFRETNLFFAYQCGGHKRSNNFAILTSSSVFEPNSDAPRPHLYTAEYRWVYLGGQSGLHHAFPTKFRALVYAVEMPRTVFGFDTHAELIQWMAKSIRS